MAMQTTGQFPQLTVPKAKPGKGGGKKSGGKGKRGC